MSWNKTNTWEVYKLLLVRVKEHLTLLGVSTLKVESRVWQATYVQGG